MPISWVDIEAFISLSGQRLAPWEVRVIEALDEVYLTSLLETSD